MKKVILLAAVAVAALSSCSKDNAVETKSAADGNVVAFRTVTEKTKATAVDSENIGTFRVSALNTPAVGAAPTAFNYMDGVSVTRDINASTWSYAPAKYWPTDGTDVDFYAYSPAGSVNVSSFVSDGTKAEITYVVPTNASADTKSQEDFLVAIAKAKNYSNSNPSMLFSFKHALSMATFSATNANAEVTVNITAIELVNLSVEETIDLAAATPAWTATGAKTNTYNVALPATGVSVLPNTSTATGLISANEGVMIMPQESVSGGTSGNAEPADFATKSYVVITYVMTDASGTVLNPSNGKKYLALDHTFVMGKKYNFKFAFDTLNTVVFGVQEVEGWGNADDVTI